MQSGNNFKKYQIFISSTFEDLKEERAAIFEAILEEKHIPAGMELFATSDKRQMEYIKQRILDCDYYVLIIGFKCGSLDIDGVSFTEKEYDFAIENNIPIMSFVMGDNVQLRTDKYEKDPTKLTSFQDFKNKITSNGRMCKFFINKEELKSHFKTAIHEYINDYPRTGWVRSDSYEVMNRMRAKDNEVIKKLIGDQTKIISMLIGMSVGKYDEDRNGTEIKFNLLSGMLDQCPHFDYMDKNDPATIFGTNSLQFPQAKKLAKES